MLRLVKECLYIFQCNHFVIDKLHVVQLRCSGCAHPHSFVRFCGSYLEAVIVDALTRIIFWSTFQGWSRTKHRSPDDHWRGAGRLWRTRRGRCVAGGWLNGWPPTLLLDMPSIQYRHFGDGAQIGAAECGQRPSARHWRKSIEQLRKGKTFSRDVLRGHWFSSHIRICPSELWTHEKHLDFLIKLRPKSITFEYCTLIICIIMISVELFPLVSFY